ncbi:MAG: ribbon-helix-helix protein, CopG family, partial [Spirochaetaceae bacterium]|nr:ribbon-helix-helix protein, CopG family [Spirochaetaceae bacterium]
MSKRLQVLLDEDEYAEIQRIARENRMTVAEWVRDALRKAKRACPHTRAEQKLRALEQAVSYEF